VWNESAAARVVLLFDVVHPGLDAADTAWVVERALPRTEKHAAIRCAARWHRAASVL